jgi:hypothetical protein
MSVDPCTIASNISDPWARCAQRTSAIGCIGSGITVLWHVANPIRRILAAIVTHIMQRISAPHLDGAASRLRIARRLARSLVRIGVGSEVDPWNTSVIVLQMHGPNLDWRVRLNSVDSVSAIT